MKTTVFFGERCETVVLKNNECLLAQGTRQASKQHLVRGTPQNTLIEAFTLPMQHFSHVRAGGVIVKDGGEIPPDYVAAQMKVICTEGDYFLPPQIRNLT